MLRRLWLPALVGIAVVAVVLCFSGLIFGWHRLVVDYWPLDRSPIGPNLVASITVGVLIVAHNEYRTIRDAEAKGETTEQVVDAALEELLHPTL